MTLAAMSPTPATRTPEAEEAKRQARETFARTLALMENEDFAFFLKECVDVEIAMANEQALNTDATDRQRDNAGHIHKAMLRVSRWVKQQHATAKQNR